MPETGDMGSRKIGVRRLLKAMLPRSFDRVGLGPDRDRLTQRCVTRTPRNTSHASR
jgi:hypothetical protein